MRISDWSSDVCSSDLLSNFLPLPDGGHLMIGAGRTQAEVARFSPRDAEALPRYEAALDAIADVLRQVVLETPPNVVGGFAELLKGLRLGRRLRRLDLVQQRELLDLFAKSAGAYLQGWFESDPVKAVFGFDGVVGHFASP